LLPPRAGAPSWIGRHRFPSQAAPKEDTVREPFAVQCYEAQDPGKPPTIGILGSGSAAWSHLVSALTQRLHELGYVENRNVAIEYRWTEGRNEGYAAMAAELVGLHVDIIVALGTPPNTLASWLSRMRSFGHRCWTVSPVGPSRRNTPLVLTFSAPDLQDRDRAGLLRLRVVIGHWRVSL
jgi:hypothetical protein